MRLLCCFLMIMLLSVTSSRVMAQDTLPNFSVTTKGNNRVIVSWTNNYRYVSQISIQRSMDSLKNFSTILTVPDPSVPQNGFVDSKGPNTNLYYRLFIVLDSGKYVFSKSRKPIWDTASQKLATTDAMPVNGSRQVIVSGDLSKSDNTEIKKKTTAPPPATVAPEPEKYFILVKKDSILGSIPQGQYRKFRDSVVNKTKDTILFKTVDTIQIKPFIPREVYRPSRFVYTERDGNIAISLPDAAAKKYHIKFFEDNLEPLFEVKKIREPYLLLDKVNFQHSGWFRFELYEGTRLVEKHRFLIPKEF